MAHGYQIVKNWKSGIIRKTRKTIKIDVRIGEFNKVTIKKIWKIIREANLAEIKRKKIKK